MFSDLIRIDIGLGWVALAHETYRPSIELVFPEGWIGIRCDALVEGRHILDEDLATYVIQRAIGGR
jgi:hypothetical protein